VNVVPQHLFIVSRQQPALYSYLAREFSEEPDVRVILDRRQGERRRHHERRAGDATDRRQHPDRRTNGDAGGQLSALGYAFVRVG
jgi:hypothetical protein